MCVIKSTLLKFNEETFLRSSLIIYASSRYSWYFSHNSWDKMCVWRYMFSLANKLMIVKWTCKQFREDEGNKGNNKGKGDWDWHMYTIYILYIFICICSVQFSRSVVSDSLWPHESSTPGLPIHHQLLEFTQTHVHRVGDAIQPSHPLSSPSPPAPNPYQHQSLFQRVNSMLLLLSRFSRVWLCATP